MAVPMPPVVVLIVCKILFVGEPSSNDQFTNWRNSEWAYENSKMVCRRHEVQLYDRAVDQGAIAMPFTTAACQRAIPMLAAQFDVDFFDRPWRVWRAACPVPTVDTKTGEVLSWTLPDCGHRETVTCEKDTVI